MFSIFFPDVTTLSNGVIIKIEAILEIIWKIIMQYHCSQQRSGNKNQEKLYMHLLLK